jgi:MFS transporter, OFA family, oxalate/formate antiporter
LLKNRWFVVVGALLIQISLGAVYIYSVFKTPLTELFKWDKAQVTLPSQLVLVFFALAVIFAGRVQDKLGPRWVATAGGVILGVGLMLAGLSDRMGGLGWFVATFSVVGGLGIGIAYVCPIAACVKWFPDKRGLITGLAVAGFGAGGLVFAPLAKSLIAAHGVLSTLQVLGVIFLVAVVVGAQFLNAPPAGYKPEGWSPPATSAGVPSLVDYDWKGMLATPQFYLLWLSYFAGCTAGLMIIMNASTIYQSFSAGLMAQGSNLDEKVFQTIVTAGAGAVSTIAIFNALGRIGWGYVSDAIKSRTVTLVIMFVLCAVAMFSLNWMRTFPLYITGTCLIGLVFGGYLALYPALTADFFGTKNIGINYGFMFSAYGAGGLVGPLLQAKLVETSTTLQRVAADGTTKPFDVINYQTAFLVSGVMCVLAVILMLVTKRPAPKQA